MFKKNGIKKKILIMEKYYINIKVEGGKEEISEFLSLCAKIRYLGRIGANRDILLQVDGDGSGQLEFKTMDTEGNLIDQFELKEFKESIDDGTTQKHYIGE
jgi:hypothetical protein